MTERRIQIGVVGSGAGQPELLARAERVGREIARHGAVLVCGGLGGVMEASAKGARMEGGAVVGILPGYSHDGANQWVDIVVPTGLGHARNVVVVTASEAVVALPGGAGTLSEVCLALKVGRPVVILGHWTDPRGVLHAESPQSAVREALLAASRGG